MLIANDPCWLYFHDHNKIAPCGRINVFFFLINWTELNQLYIYHLFLPQLIKSHLNLPQTPS